VVLVLWAGTASASTRQYTIEQVKIINGDHLAWAEQDYDDSQWPSSKVSGVLTGQKNYWLRFHLTVSDVLTADNSSQLFFHHIGSTEIYWDGILILRNGKVGLKKADEIPGKMDSLIVIPHHLYRPGRHIVAIRISRHHFNNNPSLLKTDLKSSYDFKIGAYGTTHTQHTGKALLPLITLGGTLVVAGYFIFIFLIDRKQLSSLFFALTCIGVVGMLLGETWRGLYNYGYDWHVFRLRSILTFTTLVGISLPWFIYHHFYQLKLPIIKKILLVHLVLIIGFINLVSGYDLRSAVVIFIGLILALSISFIACKNKLVGAIPMAMGLILCLVSAVFDPRLFLNETFYYLFPVMTLFFLASVAMRNKQNKQQRDQALIQSERLKIELLKKNIHPHFILNSLTTLASWISVDVKVANKMILALAQEFKSLIALSEHNKVSLFEELKLCRSHLEIMGYRKDQIFELNVVGQENNLLIPPGTLHTLLENALSHNRYIDPLVTFEVQVLLNDHRVQLLLTVPIGYNVANKVKNNDAIASKMGISAGTGTQYIKARLEEAWPNNWHFESELVKSCWLTRLNFPEEFSS